MRDELIDITTILGTTKNENGFPTNDSTQVLSGVFAEKKSVGMTEYYKAMANQKRVDVIFEIDEDDFKMSEVVVDGKVKHASVVSNGGIQYTIARSYNNKTKHIVALTCVEVD